MKSLLQRFVFLVCILGCAVPVLAAPKKKAKKTTESQERRIALANKNSDSGKRVALVIGNGAYSNSPLNNPVNDAKDIAAKLRDLGFEVIERKNLTTRQIGGTLREFRSKLAPGAVALVFYAGHGLQIKGDNYLPAVDADINSEEDVPNQSLSVKQIMDVLDESKSRLNLVFLDACRNNPYARSFRSAGSGLARVSAPSGTLISYATKPGSVAADGSGRNGLYTSKLLAQMNSNLQIEQALKRIVTEVKKASNGKQEPWMEGSIEGDFCFGGCGDSSGGNTGVAGIGPVSVPAPSGGTAGNESAIVGPLAFLDGDWSCSIGGANYAYTAHYTVRGNQVKVSASTNFTAVHTAVIIGGVLVMSGRSTSNPEFGEIIEKYQVLNDRTIHGYANSFRGVENKVNIDCRKSR